MAALLEAFCERVQGGLAQGSFEQPRQLVLLLIDRVVVTDAAVEIRYVLPTSPDSEHVRFCHLRKDYFNNPPPRVHHETDLIGWFPDDLDSNAGCCGRSVSCKAHVCEHFGDERKRAP